MSLQTTHNTTTTSLQRELDTVRQESQKLKVQLRDLEMGNDDLERNERAVASTLADIEAKYSRVLEEKILLEYELLDKASLEEESQRLKDELRGAFDRLSLPQSLRVCQRCWGRNVHPQGPALSCSFKPTKHPFRTIRFFSTLVLLPSLVTSIN